MDISCNCNGCHGLIACVQTQYSEEESVFFRILGLRAGYGLRANHHNHGRKSIMLIGGGGGSAARMNIKYAVGHGTTRY